MLGKITHVWAPGCDFEGKADPNKVADELAEMGENVEEEDVLERAKDETTELHNCFEWNDTVAAYKYRLKQAHYVLEKLYIIKEEPDEDGEPKEPTKIRMMYHVPETRGYMPTKVIMTNQDTYQKMLEQARRELAAFKKKYAFLKELKTILDLIE